MSTWQGVFVPTTQNILGIILFIRLPFITAQAGIFQVRERALRDRSGRSWRYIAVGCAGGAVQEQPALLPLNALSLNPWGLQKGVGRGQLMPQRTGIVSEVLGAMLGLSVEGAR